MTQEDNQTPFQKHLKKFWGLGEQQPIPQDIEKWIEDEAEKYSVNADHPFKGLKKWGFIDGSTAMYQLLLPELQRLKDRIKSLESSLSASERFRMEDTWAKVKEIESLKAENEELKKPVVIYGEPLRTSEEELRRELDKKGNEVMEDAANITYWKQRCEAAEENIDRYGDWQDASFENEALEEYEKWQTALKTWRTLKQQTHD